MAQDPAVEAALVEPGSETLEPALPVLSVVKGQPSAEELAALTAVVLSLGSGDAVAAGKPTARDWVRRQQLRLAPTPGPGAWRRSRG
ncbi:acyl-CoA carboxylase subunit epsilon [Pseudarthrobacter sp. AL07]|uniref:acyl-CoA carboxylase subunit epsilon n=1 Tax=unclassified Pseudarthrobacter TaxID=2647000 RepID=UPI00249C0B8B|nr:MULTISPECIES: acyl-CoA carboxylase subunit epsilon [unclassified Pseudarthrobacter]MDI3193397.1 acyl-CoA carboxylase subunit epsilon [Pseudarthrobacter sp. AL20]MDI3207465.1 acyl-CoA carboxylase subunit epsilon [Pseudarthrobacter sp. AL07]